MKLPRSTFLLFLVGILLLLGGFLLGKNTSQRTKDSKVPQKVSITPTGDVQKEQESAETVLVTKVIDGDTIQIEGGRTVRYIGIDAPETHNRRTGIACYAREATEENQRLVEGKRVRLEKDVSETDKFGRLLRYVYIDQVFVNDHLVRQGFAQVSTFPPDVTYQSQFLQAQKEARKNNRGLWGACRD